MESPSVTYLTKDFEPVDKDDPRMVMVKVRQPDGKIVFGFPVKPVQNKLFLFGGPGSGDFGHKGRPGEIGGSSKDDNGTIIHENVPLTKGNLNKILQWSTSRYNENKKSEVVNTSMNILSGNAWNTMWAKHAEPGVETVDIEPLGGEARVKQKVTIRLFRTGGYTPSSTMGGQDYLVDGNSKTISRGYGDSIEQFVPEEVWHFSEPKKNSMFHFGGKGSGDFGHSGRPGLVGGSGKGDTSLSIERIKSNKKEFAKIAQKVYDQWNPSDSEFGDPELGFGGICQDIADGISSRLTEMGYEAATISAQIGEQHVWSIVKTEDGVYQVDISPYIYETGGGYNWKKIPDVTFEEGDIEISFLDETDKFSEYIEE